VDRMVETPKGGGGCGLYSERPGAVSPSRLGSIDAVRLNQLGPCWVYTYAQHKCSIDIQYIYIYIYTTIRNVLIYDDFLMTFSKKRHKHARYVTIAIFSSHINIIGC
jgi:hypothetical protein